MRRVLLFAAFLLLLGLTTATAASFDVQAEDITSFSQGVTIVTPPPPGTKYFLVIDDDEDQFDDEITSDDTKLGGNVFDATLAQGESRSWNTDVLTSPLLLTARQASLAFYKNAGAGTIRAVLLDCPTELPGEACIELASGEAVVPETEGVYSLPFSSPTADAPVGHRLRLRIEAKAVTSSAAIKIQFGKNQPGKDSHILISAAS